MNDNLIQSWIIVESITFEKIDVRFYRFSALLWFSIYRLIPTMNSNYEGGNFPGGNGPWGILTQS